MSKFLIVNADDLGLTEGTNRAVIDCFNNGIVRSASLMSPGKAFDGAVLLAKQNPGLSIGVHLTLAGERSVATADSVRSLVDGNGNLPQSHKQFIIKYLTRGIALNDVRVELEAQLSKVRDAGIKISHINSHQHLHVLPGIIDIVLELAKKFKIDNIRIPFEGFLTSLSPSMTGLSFLSRAAKRKVIASGLNTTDHFWGIKESGHLNEAALLGIIVRCKPGSTEIMCHPAYKDALYDKVYAPYYAKTGYNHRPEQEVQALTSALVKEKLEKEAVILSGFGKV